MRESHAMAGKTVTVKAGQFAGSEYRVEDYWQNVAGKSWGDCNGNPACLEYAFRGAAERTPTDDEVVYGKIGRMGKLIHVSQLGDVVTEE